MFVWGGENALGGAVWFPAMVAGADWDRDGDVSAVHSASGGATVSGRSGIAMWTGPRWSSMTGGVAVAFVAALLSGAVLRAGEGQPRPREGAAGASREAEGTSRGAAGASRDAMGDASMGQRRQPIDFNRDIRPMLSANCFACHGPDEGHREADLRLDVREAAIDWGAIVPAAADESEMIRRILSDDPDEVMPPPHTGDMLSAEQKTLFARWIDEGAEYAEHWAFVPPQRPAVPTVSRDGWARNAIDRFVLARMQKRGLSPSPEADRLTLIRRLSLDLTGLPPTVEEADAFATDRSPDAYERLVDRLLDSPRYGERWAQLWLDLARYSDTNGYEKDRERSIWPYRDWVIRAINDDLPFDRFTVEQLAGDMLPDATPAQQTATGFHRNTMLNEEGGIDPLEYRYYAMVDRVATTGTVWLGLSTGCAQCHTHKYDPITHTDYFSLMALLNNADEPDLVLAAGDAAAERERIEAAIAELEAALPERFPPLDGDGPTAERRRQNFERSLAAWARDAASRAESWRTIVPAEWTTNLPRLEVLDDGSLLSTGDITKRDEFELTFELTEGDVPLTAVRLEVMPDDRLPGGGPGRSFYEGRKGDFFLSELSLTFAADQPRESDDAQPLAVKSPSHSFGKIAVGSGDAKAENVFDSDGSTGWSTATQEGQPNRLVFNLAEPINAPGTLRVSMLFERHFAASLGRFRFAVADAAGDAVANDWPVEVEATLAQIPAIDPNDDRSEPAQFASLSDDDRARLARYFASVAPELAKARKPIERLRRQRPDRTTTMVLRERPADNPRPTHRHHRGEFLSPKEEVAPAIPAFLTPESGDTPANRLELARWLASESNPLAARVVVNRDWQAFFGRGLHRASDDFGTQAEPPSHPDLLDWLACEFVARGWSRKALHRLIVTSATYRQASEVDAAKRRRDPPNEWLARGPRTRLSGEAVRDAMLRSSGLLSEKMYGPGVRPPQPSSVTATAYGSPAWTPSDGDDRYRRSIYTFRKRTAPFAAYATFDAPSGEQCIVRRERSNTPLQALTLLNDAMFLEMAAALADAAVRDAGVTDEGAKPSGQDRDAIATAMFRRLLTRPPQDEERAAIVAFHESQLQRLRSNELDAATILGVGAAAQPSVQPVTTGVPASDAPIVVELAGSERSDPLSDPRWEALKRRAAWTLTARALMNLDEAITKP